MNMKTKEQRVETYIGLIEAEAKMNINIEDGWLVCTCVSCGNNMILVVYEKELETWN